MARCQLWTQVHRRDYQRIADTRGHGVAALFLGAVNWNLWNAFLYGGPLPSVERAAIRDRNERKDDSTRAARRTRSKRTRVDADRTAAGNSGYPARPRRTDLSRHASRCESHSEVRHGSTDRTRRLKVTASQSGSSP